MKHIQPDPGGAVGRSPPRKDGIGKVTGRAKYLDDLDFAGQFYGRTVRSQVAHGRIRSIVWDPAFDWADVVRGGRGRGGARSVGDHGVAAVCAALAASAGDGWRIEPDYGEAVSGTARLPEADGTVAVELVVDDRSVAREPGGPPIELPAARWRLELALDSSCIRITSLRVVAA